MRSDEPNPGLDRVRFQLRVDGVPSESPNSLRSGIHNRGYLPHVKREGASYFVTFRLSDSLPEEVLIRFLSEKAERLRVLHLQGTSGQPLKVETDEIERDYRRKMERYLDKGVGACYLRQPDIAAMAGEALRHFHGQQYLLDDWVIMPNHIHLILWPIPNFTLSEILKGRKQFIATQANRILGRTGESFWQPESFDHWIRNEPEKSRIRRYIRMNPVKAGLCSKSEDWPWSSSFRGAPVK